MQGSNQTAGLFVVSSKQQRHCMVEFTGHYEGGVGRVLSLSCILFSMVVLGNLMTFEIIELDYAMLPKPEQVLLCTKFLSDNFLQ